MLVESRTTNYRSIAVGLIDDLSNRMLLNRAAALGDAAAATPIPSRYELTWNAAAVTTEPEPNCLDAAPCTGAEMALADLYLWRAAVARALPGGKARIFRSSKDSRQIGVVVAWTANEGKASVDTDGTTTNSTAFNNPFNVTAAANGVTCPANLICHLVYVQP